MPNSKWTRFSISPISTARRPPDPEEGITQDMVTPIAPNASLGRPAVHPSTPFPFPNCYHWIKNQMFIRVKVRPEDYDHVHAVRLDPGEHIALATSFTNDFVRISEHRRRKREEAAAASGVTIAPDSESEHDSESTSELDVESALSHSEKHDDSQAGSSDTSNTTALDKIDVFGWNPDPNVGLLPLVDLWFELDEHLSPDTIPSPLDLAEEEKSIQSYVLLSSALRLWACLMSFTGSSFALAKDESAPSHSSCLHQQTA